MNYENIELWINPGCVMFTLLAGKPAFEYTNMRDTYKRIIKLAYKIPDKLTPAGKSTHINLKLIFY